MFCPALAQAQNCSDMEVARPAFKWAGLPIITGINLSVSPVAQAPASDLAPPRASFFSLLKTKQDSPASSSLRTPSCATASSAHAPYFIDRRLAPEPYCVKRADTIEQQAYTAHLSQMGPVRCLYAAREENRGQLTFASHSLRSSTPASPISTLDAQAGQLIAQLPTTLQS